MKRPYLETYGRYGPRHYLKVVKLIFLLAFVSLFFQSAVYTPIHYTFQGYVNPPAAIPDDVISIMTQENASTILDNEIDGFRAKDNTAIPKIIHQIYATDRVPAVYYPYIQSWVEHHPDHEYWLWDDISARLLVEKHYPKFIPLWDAYCHPLFRSDALRYFILHKYGGIYVDMDYVAYKNVTPLFEDHECLVVEENRPQSQLLYRVDDMIMNAFLASVPSHPYFNYLINSLPSTFGCDLENPLGNVLVSTGPIFIYLARKKYIEFTRCNVLERCYVHILPSDKMMPGWDSDVVQKAYTTCKKNTRLTALQMESCKYFIKMNFTSSPPITSETYANHLFLHLGNLANKRKPIKRVNIRDIVPNAILPRKDGKI